MEKIKYCNLFKKKTTKCDKNAKFIMSVIDDAPNGWLKLF